jgi:hypothetical protein
MQLIKMFIQLKKPQWVISDEGWEFKSRDRFCMEYIENGSRYLIEVDDSPIRIGVYIDTLKLVNGNLALTENYKELIKKRIAMSFKLMGCEFQFYQN